MTTTYRCSQCDYTTDREFNYDRHINMVHNMPLINEVVDPMKIK